MATAASSHGHRLGARRDHPHLFESAYCSWRDQFVQRAGEEGVPAEWLDHFRNSVQPNPAVLKDSNAQPEMTLSAGSYIQKLVTERRIRDGRQAATDHADRFQGIRDKFGIEAEILAAIWGIESNFGQLMGDYLVLDSLATLAFDGQRSNFWEHELISALQIAVSGAAAPDRLVGSWAGAMGHTQFMPSTYLSDSLRLSGQGHADIWGGDPSDALASTANFLIRRGWQPELPWGDGVRLPKAFDFSLSGRWNQFTAACWHDAGVQLCGQDDYSDWGLCALILPEGHRGPGFLVTKNFDILLQYNASAAYALAVGLLAKNIREHEAMNFNWTQTAPLSQDCIRELQTLLVRRGFDTGGIDGIAGSATLRSVQQWQLRRGEPPDGLPSHRILESLRG